MSVGYLPTNWRNYIIRTIIGHKEDAKMSNASETFDLYAEDYDRWFDTPEGKVLFAVEVKAVKLVIKDLEKPFLEIGVGTGRFAEQLGIEIGIDTSSNVLEIAKKRGIKVERAKGESLPFKNESFGAVFLFFTLCFVEEPEMVLSEAKRVLKTGGGLIVGIINRESPWGKLYLKKKGEKHPIYKYARFYSINEVAGMVEKAGMVIEAYSSTLCQPPSQVPYEKSVHNELIENAGFVCILARKIHTYASSY
jgi:ubiquinone/menaquinone biosynthesis C-methylase UbiE